MADVQDLSKGYGSHFLCCDFRTLRRSIKGRLFFSYGLLSDCQKTKGEFWSSDMACKMPIGTLEMSFVSTWNDNLIAGMFVLTMHDSKSCVAFSSVGWENVAPVEWWYPAGYLSIYNGATDEVIYNPSGEYNNLKIDKSSISNISDACKKCDDNGECSFWFVVRHDW